MSAFDEQIQGVCQQVNRIVDKIQEHVPDWQPAQGSPKADQMDTSWCSDYIAGREKSLISKTLVNIQVCQGRMEQQAKLTLSIHG